jgi:O-antigen ligase
VAAEAVGGRSAKDVTSGRSRLVSVTLEAYAERPIAGVGIGGQPRASSELSGKGRPSRNASHTTPFTVLAELGAIGFALYVWLLAAVGWALVAVTRIDRAFGIGLAAVLVALLVHSFLYAGLFEDPLTWGALALAAAVLAREAAARESAPADLPPGTPALLAH